MTRAPLLALIALLAGPAVAQKTRPVDVVIRGGMY